MIFIVHGVTEEQHNKNMRSLIGHARENGLVFNPKKCPLKADSVMFFECLYDRNGIRPDPAKVEAIQAMPAPTCLHEAPRIYWHGHIPKEIHQRSL